MKHLLMLASLCVFLAGCGQKGPLYLPEDPAPQESSYDDEDDDF